jgi:hypothetical protein
MKSQFKKADASGARHALIFGADELARGEVAVKPLRDAAAAQRTRALADRSRLGAELLTHNRGFPPKPHVTHHGHTTRPARAGTARRAQGVLEAVRQPHHLGADPGAGRLCRLERLALVAARPGPSRPAPCSTNSTAPSQAGDADKAGRVFADLKERFPRTALPSRAGLLAAKLQFDKGQADGQGQPDLGGRQRQRRRDTHRRAAAPGRAAGRRQAVRRGAEDSWTRPRPRL